MHLLLATTNPGKLRDFAAAAHAFPGVTLAPLPRLDELPAPDETALTFEGNARLKALAYAAHAPGAVVLADDSGLVVPALGSAPGVRSARFAEDEHFPGLPGQTLDERNTACLLARAAHLDAAARAASYVCVLAAAQDGAILATVTGELRGELLREPRGTGGFGYDPIFFLRHERLTMAEVSAETRTRQSHRVRALTALLTAL